MPSQLETIRSSATGTEIAATATSAFADEAREIVAQFEQQAAHRRDRYSLWMGWGPSVLRSEDAGYVVESPDYGGNAPQERTDDLTWALYSIAATTSTLTASGIPAQEITYTDSVVVAEGWETAPPRHPAVRPAPGRRDHPGRRVHPSDRADGGSRRARPGAVLGPHSGRSDAAQPALGALLSVLPMITPRTRRPATWIASLLAVSTLLASCSSPDTATEATTTTSAGSTSSSAPSETTEPSTETTETATDASSTDATTTAETIARTTAAAEAFLATLSDEQREAVLYAYDDETKSTSWSNFPVTFVERDGLNLTDLTEEQQLAALEVLRELLSEEAYATVVGIMDGDAYLLENSSTTEGSLGQYYLALFGDPADSAAWSVQFGGHHLGINADLDGAAGAITFAPTHLGVQPAVYTGEDGVEVQPFDGIYTDAFAFFDSLTARATAGRQGCHVGTRDVRMTRCSRPPPACACD